MAFINKKITSPNIFDVVQTPLLQNNPTSQSPCQLQVEFAELPTQILFVHIDEEQSSDYKHCSPGNVLLGVGLLIQLTGFPYDAFS